MPRKPLTALEQEQFDLLFSDVVMPEMSGLDLARLTRERYPDLPVLLATGYSEEISDDAATEFEVIRKPYGADALGAKISSALEKKPAASRVSLSRKTRPTGYADELSGP